MSDKQKEQIRFHTEIMKLFAITLLTTVGGIITLIIGGADTGKEIIFTAGGMIVCIACIRGIYNRYQAILKLIKSNEDFL